MVGCGDMTLLLSARPGPGVSRRSPSRLRGLAGAAAEAGLPLSVAPREKRYKYPHPRTRAGAAGRGQLDQVCLQGDPGQVGAAPAAGLVPDPVQVGADGADADEQLLRDLRVGPAAGDQGDQLPLPRAELG